MKKYEFTGEIKAVSALNDLSKITVRRIRAIISFGNIKAGAMGGWIEKEANLSHENNAWIDENAVVYDSACVGGNAKIHGKAVVCGNAEIYGNAEVYDNACVCGNSKIYGDAKVYGDTKVYDNAWVYGNAEVYDNACVGGYAEVSDNAFVYDNAEIFGSAEICGHAKVYGKAVVCDNAVIYGNIYGRACVSGNAWLCGNARVLQTNHLLVFGPCGSRNDFTTFFRDKGNEITVKCGCFLGKMNKFLEEVQKTYGDNKHARVYRLAAEIAKLQIENDVNNLDII